MSSSVARYNASLAWYDPNLVEVKSKFECEFRRFSVDRTKMTQYDDFHTLIQQSHNLPSGMPFTVSYTDPQKRDLLPITNTANMLLAFRTSLPLLRVFVYKEKELMFEEMKMRERRSSSKGSKSKKRFTQIDKISAPQNDFRKIGSIVDTDILPDSVRRVQLVKQSADRPLGFYIRENIAKLPGHERISRIYISRLVPGGLAEGTGLLSVNDEITEVNGIEIQGKTLDQVTDMMIANSQNLIITVRPAAPPPQTPPLVSRSASKSPKMTNAGFPASSPKAHTRSSPAFRHHRGHPEITDGMTSSGLSKKKNN